MTTYRTDRREAEILAARARALHGASPDDVIDRLVYHTKKFEAECLRADTAKAEAARRQRYPPDRWYGESFVTREGALERNRFYGFSLEWSLFEAKGVGIDALVRRAAGNARKAVREWAEKEGLT